MSRPPAVVVALTVAALATVLSCSSRQGAPPPASSPTGSPAADATGFERLGYRLVVPQDWIATEGYLDWAALDAAPHRGTPAFDTISSPEDDPWIVVGSRPVKGVSLARWIDTLRSDHVITYASDVCGPSRTSGPRPSAANRRGCSRSTA